MISMRVDASNVLANHAAMARMMEAGINEASEQAKDILVQSVRDDLAKKILRPRESSGELSEAIDGEIIRTEGDIIIGIGNMDRMTAEVPYWRLQDEGGPIAVNAVPGYFVDVSGSRVPFDKSRAPIAKGTPHGFVRSKASMDLFIYQKGAGSIMWIHGDVKPKRFFEAGELDAREKVLEKFRAVLRRVFK